LLRRLNALPLPRLLRTLVIVAGVAASVGAAAVPGAAGRAVAAVAEAA